MEEIKKILAPTDFSPLSLAGLQHALEIAGSQGMELIAYHVIHKEEMLPYYRMQAEAAPSRNVHSIADLIEERKARLAEFLRQNFADLSRKTRIRVEVDIGIPHKRIVEKAREEGATMIVMSTHGRTGLLHMLLGSVTEKVIRRASCPVLSIRPEVRIAA